MAKQAVRFGLKNRWGNPCQFESGQQHQMGECDQLAKSAYCKYVTLETSQVRFILHPPSACRFQIDDSLRTFGRCACHANIVQWLEHLVPNQRMPVRFWLFATQYLDNQILYCVYAATQCRQFNQLAENLSVNQVDSILADKLVAIIGSIGNILLRIEKQSLGGKCADITVYKITESCRCGNRYL